MISFYRSVLNNKHRQINILTYTTLISDEMFNHNFLFIFGLIYREQINVYCIRNNINNKFFAIHTLPKKKIAIELFLHSGSYLCGKQPHLKQINAFNYPCSTCLLPFRGRPPLKASQPPRRFVSTDNDKDCITKAKEQVTYVVEALNSVRYKLNVNILLQDQTSLNTRTQNRFREKIKMEMVRSLLYCYCFYYRYEVLILC